MAWFIKVTEKEDFDYLKKFVDRWAVKCRDNVGTYVEYIDMFTRLEQAFNNAVQAEEVSVVKEVEKQKRTSKVKEEVATIKLCPSHPTYQAKRSPRTDCEGCWEAFEKYAGKSRAIQARQKFERKASG